MVDFHIALVCSKANIMCFKIAFRGHREWQWRCDRKNRFSFSHNGWVKYVGWRFLFRMWTQVVVKNQPSKEINIIPNFQNSFDVSRLLESASNLSILKHFIMILVRRGWIWNHMQHISQNVLNLTVRVRFINTHW